MNLNTSIVPDSKTAKTCIDCASQRAENLFLLGSKNVLELCVGPSLKYLEAAYSKYGISATGNDIDPRWKKYYKQGKWIIGDALKVDYNGFDTVVFAPPLSRGCTGKRNDALMIDEVLPKYKDFLKRSFNGLVCLVLPGRSMATKEDRNQFHKLIKSLSHYECVELKSKGVVKYYDIYIRN